MRSERRTKFTEEEKHLIKSYLNKRLSLNQIAKIIGRDGKTVSREISKRGGRDNYNPDAEDYSIPIIPKIEPIIEGLYDEESMKIKELIKNFKLLAPEVKFNGLLRCGLSVRELLRQNERLGNPLTKYEIASYFNLSATSIYSIYTNLYDDSKFEQLNSKFNKYHERVFGKQVRNITDEQKKVIKNCVDKFGYGGFCKAATLLPINRKCIEREVLTKGGVLNYDPDATPAHYSETPTYFENSIKGFSTPEAELARELLREAREIHKRTDPNRSSYKLTLESAVLIEKCENNKGLIPRTALCLCLGISESTLMVYLRSKKCSKGYYHELFTQAHFTNKEQKNTPEKQVVLPAEIMDNKNTNNAEIETLKESIEAMKMHINILYEQLNNKESHE